MTESSFSGKKEPHSKKAYSTRKILPKVVGKLGFRVFFVALVFLVIPMGIHSWIKYVEDDAYHKKLLFVGLSEIATGKARFTQQIVQDKSYIIDLLASQISNDAAQGSLQNNIGAFEALFQIVNRDRLTGAIFYQSLDNQGDFTCSISSEKLLLNKKNIFKAQQQQAIKSGQSVFLDIDPVQPVKEIFVCKPVYLPHSDQAIGTITLSLDALGLLNWIAMVETGPLYFQLSYMGKGGDLYVGQSEKVNPDDIYEFNINPYSDSDVLFNQVSHSLQGKHYLSVISKQKEMLGIQVNVPGTNFHIMAVSTLATIAIPPSSQVLNAFLSLVLVYLVIGGGLALLITIRISRPLNALCQVMEHVEKGDLTARYHHDKIGFEINVLGHTFNRMIDAVIHHVEEARSERVARELLTKELKIGHDIQRSILPKQSPHFPGYDIAAGFQGAKEVAGDFYDIFLTTENRMVFSVADAAGKGISACLYSLCARSMLRSFAASTDRLEDMIRETNNLLCLDTADSGNFVTAWVGVLDTKTNKLHFASCGHLPAILRRNNGAIEEITTQGIALGVMPIQDVMVGQVQLEKGDLLILYTDGITESQDSYFEFYNKRRLLEVVQQEGAKTAEEIVDAILGSVEMFSLNIPLYDDRTLLVIRIT